MVINGTLRGTCVERIEGEKRGKSAPDRQASDDWTSHRRRPTMINALRYEPRGHRQRFESHEQQEQDWHLHLHFHLNLTFRAQKAHSIHPNAMRITSIFSDLLAA